MESAEVIVIGGGLGGLCSATLLARAGHAVRLLEQAEHVGGRARSRTEQGFVHNLGAHAFYRGGAGSQVLASLGVAPSGRRAGGSGGYVLHGDELNVLPGGLWSLLRTGAIGARGKLQLARLLLTLGERTAQMVRGQTVSQWLDGQAVDARTRALLEMLVRLTTYAHAPERFDADIAVRQLAGAARNGVIYVDGGWQTIVDQVKRRAVEAGVRSELGVGVARIEHGEGVQAVTTHDGRRLPAWAVVAGVEPRALSALLPGDSWAARTAASVTPLRAACLDLGVRGLPHPERVNVLSTDAPLYFANHSAYATLAPEGASTLHLVRYLGPDEDGRSAEPELRAFLERVQPGVYARAVVKRFMPNLTVHNDVPSSARAAAQHPEISGLHLVGDWVDSGGCLLDGVLASARTAVSAILAARTASTVAPAHEARDAEHAA